MGIFGKKKEPLEYQFIARPDSAKELLFYKWPDTNIRFLSVVTVQPDEQAIFIDRGQIRGYLDEGQHRLDGPGVPILQEKIDEVTGGRVLLGELYFVSTRQFANLGFAGPMGQVSDPETDVMVGINVTGSFALKATDPGKLLLHLLGTRRPLDNREVVGVASEHLLLVLRSVVSSQITEHAWPVLKVTSGAYNPSLEQAALPAVNERLIDYGIAISAIQDFSVKVDPADASRLKEIYDRRAKTKLAADPNYAGMAEAEAMLGAAEGLKSGGSGGSMSSATDFAGMGIGLGIGMKMADKFVQGSGEARMACPACGVAIGSGKFCPACGERIAGEPASGDQ